MTDRPILFSGLMVQAILDGRKTQTRRVLKPQPFTDGYYEGKIDCTNVDGGARFGATAVGGGAIRTEFVDYRYLPGDRLWVREAWVRLPKTAYGLPKIIDPGDHDMAAYYRAGFDRSGKKVWRSSIHMPRWSSRITLLVTDVRVQRLQDISEEDAKAEGVERVENGWLGPSGLLAHPTAKQAFQVLWNSINSKRTGCDWQSNPWVAAYSFKPILQNIDAITQKDTGHE